METALSCAALALSIVSGGLTFYIFMWTKRRDRRQATLRAATILQTDVFDRLNDYSPDRIREICSNHHSEEYKRITGYFARLEHFCVGINEKVYDRETFYKLTHGYFDGPRMRERLNVIFESKNHTGPNRFYSNTRTVLEWMDKKTKLSER